MKRRYKYILSFLLAVLLAVPEFAKAVKIDLVPYAGAYLTQVIGFTEEEASRFIPEVQEDGSVIGWKECIVPEDELGDPQTFCLVYRTAEDGEKKMLKFTLPQHEYEQ